MKKKLCCIAAVIITALLALCGCGETSGGVSGSDAALKETKEPVVWEQAADDGEFFAMMQEKMDEYIVLLTGLSDDEERLKAMEKEEKIKNDEDFIYYAGQLGDWCEGAENYSQSGLSSENAKEICRMIKALGEDTSGFVADYPSLVCGTGTAARQDRLVTAAAEIYIALMNSTV